MMTNSDDPGSLAGPSEEGRDWRIVLLSLSDRIGDLEDQSEIFRVACLTLGSHLGLERVGFARIMNDRKHCRVLEEWRGNPDLPALQGEYDLAAFGDEVVDALVSGRDIVWSDVAAEIAAYERQLTDTYRSIRVRAMLNIPISRHGVSEAFLYVHQHHMREWRFEQVLLAREIAERTWANIERLRYQQELSGVNERLRLVLEASNMGTWDWDLITDTIEWSENLQKMLGYEPGTINPTFDLWKETLHPDDRDYALGQLEQARRDELYDVAFRINRRDGAIRWFSTKGRFFRDKLENPVRMVGVVEDVTEVKKTELDLRESEERFRLIVENAKDYAIFTTDRDGKIDSWPPGAQATFGWAPNEVLGREADFLFIPEDRNNDVPEIEFSSALENGFAPDVRWHQHKDGSRVFIDGSVWPLHQANGSFKGFLKIGQDVTQRREAEIALRNSEERFRKLTATVPHLVFRSTTRGERIWASPQWAEYTGMSDKDSVGLGWLEAVHPDDRQLALKKWDEAASGDAYYGEHRIRRHSDGMYRWHQTRAVLLPSDSGKPDEWVGSAVDIHDIRQLQERQGVLVAELQHRTRNLLGIIRGIVAQTAAGDAMGPFREAFNLRLAALSRVQGFLVRDKAMAVSLRELITSELDALGADWEQVTLQGPQIPLSDINLQTLALALHELSVNAFKHGALSGAGGRLAITWRLAPTEGGEMLVIEWREDFPLPRVNTETVSTGFGRQLITEALPYQLGAQTRFSLKSKGLLCVIEIPFQGTHAR